MPGRGTGLGDYRYAYNGMELDNEVCGVGNSYTTEFRQYDPRLMRWKSLDPLMHQFPWMSPYVAFDNNPIYFVDPFGLKGGPAKEEPNYIVNGKRDKPMGRRLGDDGHFHKWKKGDKYINPKGDIYTYKGDENQKGTFEDKWDKTVMVDKVQEVDEIQITVKREITLTANEYMKLQEFNPNSKFKGEGSKLIGKFASLGNGGNITISGEQYDQLKANEAAYWEQFAKNTHTGSGAATPVYPEIEILLLTEGVSLNSLTKKSLSELSISTFSKEAFVGVEYSAKITFPTADEIAKRLATTVKIFHDQIKPMMKKDFSSEMKKINSTNPDIGIDEIGNIVLKNPKTGKTISTNFPLDAYK